MSCATAKGNTCSVIVISTDKEQVDTWRYVIMTIGIPSLTTSKVILFYAGISVLENRVRFIFELSAYIERKAVLYSVCLSTLTAFETVENF
jgi:hypothetical protein